MSGGHGEYKINSLMRILAGVLADDLQVSDFEKPNILGIFNEIRATSYPAQHDKLMVVVMVEASASESDEQRIVHMRVLAGDANEVASFQSPVEVWRPSHPGVPVNMVIKVQALNVMFPAAGADQVQVAIDESVVDIPLYVIEAGE